MSKKRKGKKRRSGGGEKSILSDAGLVPVEPDAGLLKSEFEAAGARAWCCFTPFLYFTSGGGGSQVYWMADEGGPVILYRKERGGNVSWDIYTLAVRDRKSAERAVELADRLNGRPARILWLPEDQLRHIEHIPGVEPEYRDSEYFYDTEKVAPLRGPEFADVRKRANRFRRETSEFMIREMDMRQAERCLQLMDDWMDGYYERGYEARPVDHYYTRDSLEYFDAFEPPNFFGCVIYVEKKLAGFALAGEMSEKLANFFALKTDLSIRGLGTFFRWYMIMNLCWKGYELVNDASDLNVPGLKQHKSKFRPVETLRIYKVNRKKD